MDLTRFANVVPRDDARLQPYTPTAPSVTDRNEQIWLDEEAARKEQVDANSAKLGASVHTFKNTVVGSTRLSQPLMFDKVFLTEPSFTTGGSVIKSPPARAGSSDWRDPIITAGVVSWVRDELTYVGANVYLIVYFPGSSAASTPVVVPPTSSPTTPYPGGGGEVISSVTAPWLRAQRENELEQEHLRKAAAASTSGGEYLHFMKFYATGYANMGKGATATVAKDLPSRAPGVGEMTRYLLDRQG